MRVLVCGSRTWDDGEVVETVMSGYVNMEEPVTFVCGDARGADAFARHYAWEHGWDIEVFEADWNRLGRKAGHVRNKAMLDSGVERVVAFSNIPLTVGTANMVNQAHLAKVPTHIVACATAPR